MVLPCVFCHGYIVSRLRRVRSILDLPLTAYVLKRKKQYLKVNCLGREKAVSYMWARPPSVSKLFSKLRKFLR